MNLKDMSIIAEGMGPVMREAIAEATRPLQAKIAKLELLTSLQAEAIERLARPAAKQVRRERASR